MTLLVADNPALAAPTRAMRSRDIVRKAINDGKPLPLQVMLETMWRFRQLALDARDSDNVQEENAYWGKALGAATQAAPYVHPRLTTEPVDGGPSSDEGKANSAWAVYNALSGKSDEDVQSAYQRLLKGEQPLEVEVVAQETE